jgi:hypothetical protein
MSSVNQFAFVSGTIDYVWGAQGTIPNIPITGAPADTDFHRLAMLHDGQFYRMYFFKKGSNNTIYQFAFNGSSYHYGYNSIPIITLTHIPADADLSSFAMLWDGAAYRLYVQKKGGNAAKLELYQAAYVPGTTDYQFGYNSIPVLNVIKFPANTDIKRWSMLHDGHAYRIYFMEVGINNRLLQGAYIPGSTTYEFAYNSIPQLNIVNTPANSDTSHFAMLYGQNLYHLYFETK